MGLWYRFDNSRDWWYPPPPLQKQCNVTASHMSSLLQIFIQFQKKMLKFFGEAQISNKMGVWFRWWTNVQLCRSLFCWIAKQNRIIENIWWKCWNVKDVVFLMFKNIIVQHGKTHSEAMSYMWLCEYSRINHHLPPPIGTAEYLQNVYFVRQEIQFKIRLKRSISLG